jgi:cobyrinic acid a,c-diamide synthase
VNGQILIAGVSSGVGKTTITMGLIAALRRRGLQIQPFKAGPDYIDPTYHTLAAGRPCRNIDTWMVPPDRALALYVQAAQTTDIAVIEGVMGVFDGFSYTDEEGSTAQIAKLVGAPVLLVLDVAKMARSAGALALGYVRFDRDLPIAGFILNRCGSESHYLGVRLAVEQATSLPVVGWLPKNAELHIPERHLGLVPTDERGNLTEFIMHAANVIEKYLDLDFILAISRGERKEQKVEIPPYPQTAQIPEIGLSTFSRLNPKSKIRQRHAKRNPKSKVAVARDLAFSFYYEDNLDLLRESGVGTVFFSPLLDTKLPEGAMGLYLGGGFPEIYAARLAANTSMLEAVRCAYAAGMPIYAECGGFMYLTEAIIDLEGQRHGLVGLIPGLTRMQPRLVSLGYRLVESPTGNFLLPQGVTTRGHEFHWSTWENSASDNANIDLATLSPAWYIRPRQTQGDDTRKPSGYADKNLVASYVHLHFAYDPQLAFNFAQACREWMNRV